MATHFSVLAWRVPGTGEPGGLPSMGSHRVGHDWSDLAAAAFFMVQLSHPYLTIGKNHSLDICQQSDVLFNMLARFIIAFLPRSNHLLISWLQLPSTVIWEPKKIKSVAASSFPHLFAMKWWDWMSWSLFFACWVSSQLFHSPLSPSLRVSLVPLRFLP